MIYATPPTQKYSVVEHNYCIYPKKKKKKERRKKGKKKKRKNEKCSDRQSTRGSPASYQQAPTTTTGKGGTPTRLSPVMSCAKRSRRSTK
jgi:hypothetical protein